MFPLHPLVILMICLPMPALADTEATQTNSGPDRPRSALLAEGSIVIDLEGEMIRSPGDHLWYFRGRSDPGDPRQGVREFKLLPCQLLEDMESQTKDSGVDSGSFSLTGEVLTYGNENWLLPQHVVWVTDHARRAEPSETPPSPSGTAATESNDRPPDQGDSIADIVADLQASVGPLRKSVDGRKPPSDVGPPPDGRRLVSRRGRLGRGPTGAWVFILDADTTGLQDPSLILLPSARLTQLEAYAGYGWMGQPLLMSGELFTYRGRRFLRPTSFKIVQERPNLIR